MTRINADAPSRRRVHGLVGVICAWQEDFGCANSKGAIGILMLLAGRRYRYRRFTRGPGKLSEFAAAGDRGAFNCWALQA